MAIDFDARKAALDILTKLDMGMTFPLKSAQKLPQKAAHYFALLKTFLN